MLQSGSMSPSQSSLPPTPGPQTSSPRIPTTVERWPFALLLCVKGKNGGTDLATASGSVEVTLYLDDVEVEPGSITFNHRRQELEATFGGVLDTCQDMNFDDVIDVDQECVVTDEMIRLLLETTSANHFNFIAPNVGPGDHTIEVKADVSAAASAGDGAAKGQAVVNIGSLNVEVVRSANTTDGITVE